MKHWTYLAFDEKTAVDKVGNFNMIKPVEVKVDGDNEADSLSRAKKVITRKEYLLKGVWEDDHEDQSLHNDMQMAGLKIQKRMLDFLEKGGRASGE